MPARSPHPTNVDELRELLETELAHLEENLKQRSEVCALIEGEGGFDRFCSLTDHLAGEVKARKSVLAAMKKLAPTSRVDAPEPAPEVDEAPRRPPVIGG